MAFPWWLIESIAEWEDLTAKWTSLSRVNPDIRDPKKKHCPLSAPASSWASCSLSPSSAAGTPASLTVNSLPTTGILKGSLANSYIIQWAANTVVYSSANISEWLFGFAFGFPLYLSSRNLLLTVLQVRPLSGRTLLPGLQLANCLLDEDRLKERQTPGSSCKNTHRIWEGSFLMTQLPPWRYHCIVVRASIYKFLGDI